MIKQGETMYFIMHPSTVLPQKYYKEDKLGRLVPTKVPHLYETYDQARNAIERTVTFCKKLKKLNLYGGLSEPEVKPLPYITKHYRGQFKRDAVYRYRMHQIALKGSFYGFSPTALSIVRVVAPKPVPTGRVMETEADAIERGSYALKLSELMHWTLDKGERVIITRFLNKSTLSAVDKTVINRLHTKYERRGAGWRGEVWPYAGDFNLSGKNIVITDDSDAFSSGPANYTTPVAPDPVLEAAWAAIENRWYNRLARYLKKTFHRGMQHS